MRNIKQYEHHGKLVRVYEDQKGEHRDHCLCYTCEHFDATDREKNCRLANLIYALCQVVGMVLPVWECPVYDPIEGQATLDE